MKTKILIATHNKGKAREITAILESAGASDIEFLQPDDVGIYDSPDETGADYESNAIIKARFYGAKSGIISIADDSGLEVTALDGFPGIKSARVKAPEDSDKSRYETLLEMMEPVEEGNRAARFVCVAAAFIPKNVTRRPFAGEKHVTRHPLAGETSEIITIHEHWNGIILAKPQGDSGFGYDPVFYDETTGKSAAEMSTGEKNRVSHRGKAFRKLWERMPK
ncbi:non-canonical purine NTP pyrophosphatase [bacterium]|nr:non-canonical purine NTP pyrophosphatase [bacterium]